jgi:hypothetical protein
MEEKDPEKHHSSLLQCLFWCDVETSHYVSLGPELPGANLEPRPWHLKILAETSMFLLMHFTN